MDLLSTSSLPCSFVFMFIILLMWKVFKNPGELILNCWFCNVNSTVPAGNVNCWDCPHCDQYNGFDKEGNYNKAIPAQQYSEFNQGIFAQNPKATTNCVKFNNILCEQCNQNQQLKVQQLAMFVPDNEKTYDFEIEDYAAQLDSLYQLCLGCELQTQRKLQKVDDWVQRNLLGKRLLQFRNFTYRKHVSLLPKLLRWVVVGLSLVMVGLDVGTLQVPSDTRNNIVVQVNLLVSIVVMVIVILSIATNRQSRLWSYVVVWAMYWIISILVRLDDVLDISTHAFPWRHSLKMYMHSKGLKTDGMPIQQKILIRIFVDVFGFLLAIGFVIIYFYSKEDTKQRNNFSKPVFADLSRQSSFSTLQKDEVDCSMFPKTVTPKSQKKTNATNIKREETNPLNTSLGSLSIMGTEPNKTGQKGKERRPLINPAKFTIEDSVKQRKILIGEMDTPVSVSLASSCASSMNDSIHSTVPEGDYQFKTKGSTKKTRQEINSSSPYMYILFGVSIGINVTIITTAIVWSLFNPGFAAPLVQNPIYTPTVLI